MKPVSLCQVIVCGLVLATVVQVSAQVPRGEAGPLGEVAERGDEVREPEQVSLPVRFLRGDVDGSGRVEMSDAVATLANLFLGTRELDCKDAADSNDDGQLAISDAVHTLSFLFTGGVRMPAPFPNCGEDSTADALGCGKSPSCTDVGSGAFQMTRVEDGYLIDLPVRIAALLPERTAVDLSLATRTRGESLSGMVSKLSATTIHLATAQRTLFRGTESPNLRIKVAPRSIAFPRSLNFQCSFFVCDCSGDDDCNDMFSSDVCGGGSVCIVDDMGGVVCLCTRF